MELRIYDTELNRLGIVDEIKSLIWTPTYWNEGTVGDLKLLAPMTKQNAELLKIGNIVVLHDGPPEIENGSESWRRAAQIKYRHITKDIMGAEQVEVQGCFLKKWLSKRIVLNKVMMFGTEAEKINRIVNENCGSGAIPKRRFLDFSILEQEEMGGTASEYMNEEYSDVGKEVFSRALAGKLGFDILVNEKTRKYGFYLYKGRNLTQGNDRQSIFSREYDNVNEQEYTESEEGKKNVAYITGTENKTGSIDFLEIESGDTGIERNEIYFNLSNISRTYTQNEMEIEMQPEEYARLLREEAKRILKEDYSETISFNSSINTVSSLRYIEDFNVGDLVTCVEKTWGIKIDVRITAISLIYQNGVKEIEVTLGESIPTLLQQIRKVR